MMEPTQREEWVVVAEFHMIADGILSADLAVSKLEGSGVPARRFPTGILTSGTGGSAFPPSESVRIVVPPEQAERAREILAHSEREAETNV